MPRTVLAASLTAFSAALAKLCLDVPTISITFCVMGRRSWKERKFPNGLYALDGAERADIDVAELLSGLSMGGEMSSGGRDCGAMSLPICRRARELVPPRRHRGGCSVPPSG